MSQLETSHAVVFGISADTVESHRGFAAKEHLNFPLLADPEHKVIPLYGVSMANGMAQRQTFIIGPDGIVAGIDRDVNSTFSNAGGKLISDHGLRLALLLSNWKVKLGATAANFSLPDTNGKTVALLHKGKKATVVAFFGARCPASQKAEDALAALSANPAYADVSFLGINANADESTDEVKADAANHHITFPVTRDKDNRVADHFDARMTPEVWVLDATGVALYHGTVGDAGHPLQGALDSVVQGKPVTNAETAVGGCPIKRVPGGK